MGLEGAGMTQEEMGEAIPPLYSEFIAKEALRQIVMEREK